MTTINQLRARQNDRARAARAMLAEAGDRRWTPAQQLAFDALMQDIDDTADRIERIEGAGRFASLQARDRDALEIFLRKPHLSDDQARAVRAAMSTTTGSQGGFTVSTTIASALADALKGYGWMRQVAHQITTERGDDLNWPSSDGGAEVGELLAQNAAAAALDPSFGTRPLNAYKFSSKSVAVPLELVQDSSFDIVSFVLRRLRARIGRKQNQLFTTGSGVSEPTGIVTASSAGKIGAAGQTVTVTYDDLVDLADSVDEASLGMPDAAESDVDVEPGWMFSQTTRKIIRKVKDTNGRPIWNPSFDDGGRAGGKAQLLGHPVNINNDMPAPGANAKSILFGDLASYLIRDALEFTFFRMTDSAYALNGQVGFFAVARAGGNLLDTAAVKHYQHSAT